MNKRINILEIKKENGLYKGFWKRHVQDEDETWQLVENLIFIANINEPRKAAKYAQKAVDYYSIPGGFVFKRKRK